MRIEKILGRVNKIPPDMEYLTNYFGSNRGSVEDVFIFDPSNECECKYLHEYIDKLCLDDSALFKFKVCYEIKNLKVTYRKDGISTPCSKMSELVQLIDKTIKQDVIIENDNRTDLSNIVQQLIYLSVPLNNVRVMTRREINDADKIKRFNENINGLSQAVNYAYENIQKLKLDSHFSETRDNIAKSFEIIQENIKIVQDKTLKVAVAASKKTGKSVIVNSMLEQEIAPTSLELATPNNCIYSLSKDGKYHLDNQSFATRKDIYNEIGEKFKKVQMNSKKNFTLPDMNIQYVPNNHDFSKYTIYDTPGPDLAGATGHTNAAKKAMKEADVVVFAIDYTKYLTDSEEKYLREVKEIFDNNGKFYSLIFTVNKIDQCYTSKESKSIIRILDFIRSKIVAIDEKFKDCIIMGTSSITYFNCIEAMEIPYHENYFKDYNMDIRKWVRTLKKEQGTLKISNEQLKAYNTILSSNTGLETFIHNLEDCHDIYPENLTINDIKEFSGMPSLLNYVYYVSENKARDEKINSCISKIDIEYTKIKNILNIDELEKSIHENKEKLDNIIKIVMDFSNEVKNVFTLEHAKTIAEQKKDTCSDYYHNLNTFIKENPNLNGDNFSEFNDFIKKDIKEKINNSFDQTTITEDIVNNQFKSKLKKSIDRTFKEYNELKNEKDGKVVATSRLVQCFNNELSGISSMINKSVQDCLNENNRKNNEFLENYKISIEVIFTYMIKEDLNDIISKYKKELKKQNVNFNIETPSFNVSFETVSIPQVILQINLNESKQLFDKSIRQGRIEEINKAHGLSRFFQVIFGRREYVTIFEFEKVYNNDLKKELEYAILKTNFQNQYKGTTDEYEKKVEECLNSLEEFRRYYMNTINQTIENITEIFGEDRIKLQQNVDYANNKKIFFSDIIKYSNKYFEIWETIHGNNSESISTENEVHIC